MVGAWYGADRPHLPDGHRWASRMTTADPHRPGAKESSTQLAVQSWQGAPTWPPGKQARLVKTVKVWLVLAGAVGSDRRLPRLQAITISNGCEGVAIDWVTGRSSEEHMARRKVTHAVTLGLNVQSGHGEHDPKPSRHKTSPPESKGVVATMPREVSRSLLPMPWHRLCVEAPLGSPSSHLSAAEEWMPRCG